MAVNVSPPSSMVVMDHRDAEWLRDVAARVSSQRVLAMELGRLLLKEPRATILSFEEAIQQIARQLGAKGGAKGGKKGGQSRMASSTTTT